MIEIRPMLEKDAEIVEMFLADTSEDFMNQWGGGRWYKYPVTKEQIVDVMKTRTDNTRYFIIMNDNQIIGSVELDFINWEQKESGVCRFLISEQNRSKGLGTQALQTLVNYAFKNLNMKRVYLSVFDFNISAIKCYQKAGFAKCGEVTRPNGWIAYQMEIINPA